MLKGKPIVRDDPRQHADRFWSKVARSSPDQCWFWRGALYPGGYGVFVMGHARKYRAHRVAYELANDYRPTSAEFVCHSCDNKACVNPAHLWLGTASENVRDCYKKGLNRWAKINADIAREIYHSQMPGRELAARFGIAVNYVYQIRGGHCWTHATSAPPNTSGQISANSGSGSAA